MPVKIRLSRHGKKHNAYYHIVVADSRAPRDGRFIEVIGKYNPNTNPATIEINNDKALDWLNKGAQPTDTLRAILAYKGVLFRKHLQRGVTKGLLTQEAADAKYQQWIEGKQSKVEEKRKSVLTSAQKEKEARLAEETKIKEAIAEKVRIKNIPPPVEEAPAAESAPAETEAAAQPTAEGSTETPAAE
jgi:small subunit ribosomal protein S16